MRDVNILSVKERQVAWQVARGLPNKQISHIMGVTEQTVKVHVQNAMHKLGLYNRVQLALLVHGIDIDNLPHVEE